MRIIKFWKGSCLLSLADYVPALTRLGLTEYEARVYAALVKSGSKTAGELSFLSGVPRTKLYGSVRALEQKGLVRTVRRKPETFTATSPNEALFPLAEKLVKEAEESLEKIQSLALAYESARILLSRHPLKTELAVLEGRRMINENITRLLSSATKSVDMMTSSNGIVRLYRSKSRSIEGAAAKGVKVRLISEVTPNNMSVAREFAKILELRRVPRLGVQAMLVDCNVVAFIEAVPDDLDDDVGDDIGIVSENKQITHTFKRLFDLVWVSLAATKT
ncbi:TrmB family transcriptional regulator [Candidatus Bathyarchaeota archaeon]|nr:TrmB family transcriptional regulator [Candidatus Bathyarchaeota archaeon]